MNNKERQSVKAEVTKREEIPLSHTALSDNYWKDTIRKMFKKKAAVVGLLIFATICLSCALAPVLTRWEYDHIDSMKVFEKPSRLHILGTDSYGRDVFSRLLYGGRVTLLITLVSTIVAAIIGSALGIISGYFGKRAEIIITPVLDAMASIPVIFLALVFEVVLGWGQGFFIYAIIIASIPNFARIVCASTMNTMGKEYIEAAKALGLGHLDIIFKHVLHHTVPPLIVGFTSRLSDAFLTCTIMGYLEVGIRPPIPEWGQIIFLSKTSVLLNPQLMIFPCALVVLTVISISLIGDSIRDILDPWEKDDSLNN